MFILTRIKKGEPDCYVVKTANLKPFNNYVKKNGVIIARPNKRVLKIAFCEAEKPDNYAYYDYIQK